MLEAFAIMIEGFGALTLLYFIYSLMNSGKGGGRSLRPVRVPVRVYRPRKR